MFKKAGYGVAAALVIAGSVLVIGCGGDDNKASDTASTKGTQVTSGAQGTGTQVAGGAQGAATSVASGSSGSRDITVEEKDFSFDISDTVRPGVVKITAKNSGKESHQVQVVKWNDGVTQAQFDAALKNPDPSAIFKAVTFMGGPNSIKPGQSQVAYNTLTPGNYALLCFLEADDGQPHFAKGQVKAFQVAAGDTGGSAPKADGTVTLADFNFLGDVNSLPAKKTTLEVKNGGPQPHELTVIKLNNGVTVDQLKALLNSDTPPAGPPPIDDAGGLGALQANQTGFVELDLKAGQYAFVCFVPDTATGKPHAALGMIKAIEVK
jgi:hypothetical protein